MSDSIQFETTGTTPALPPIGADVTLLLAASSFITEFNGKKDPRAAEAFSGVTSAYCNGLDLLLPLPETYVERVPIFHDLWESRERLTTIANVDLSDEAFRIIGERAGSYFAQYVEGDPSRTARWISFQFTPAIADRYLGRADITAIERCGPVARTLLDTKQLEGFQKEIKKLQQDDRVDSPYIYQDLVGTNILPSFLHLCTAYALSVALRGYSYAVALGQYPNPPLYRHHWLRSPIVRRIGSPAIPAQVEPGSLVQFPWGEILRKVFDPTKPLANRDPIKVAEVLDGIRDRSVRVRDAMMEGLLDNSGKTFEHKLTDAELFILDLLREVGISPLYTESNFLQMAVGWLRELSKGTPLIKIPVDLITGNLQPNWLRSPETLLRMRFKRDSFWQVMEDPDIRRALQKRRV